MQESRPFLVHGQWRQGDRTSRVVNPFDGRLIADVVQATESDIEQAITSTVEAGPPMGALPAHARYNILQQIAALLNRRRMR